MKKFMVAALAVFCLARAVVVWADGDRFVITAEQWALPRSGGALLKLPPLRAALQDWTSHPGARLLIVHSGTDTETLWAGELSDWLVALGVPSDHIDKRVSGDQGEDGITLVVEH
jgi:hypothetical protein